jgi:Kef-type K+ transport system membrane component KefB/voltage-gated potassium channel Kch
VSSIFLQLGLIIIVSGAFAYAARTLRQPLIPAYIIAGIILGPVLGSVTDQTIITSLSELGIAFLLFSAGLALDLKKLKEVGSGASLGALAHMIILFGTGYITFRVLHFPTLTSVYAGLILIFSSTLVVVKLLSDKKELDTLHGRIIVGILLLQDLAAIIVMSILNSTGPNLAASMIVLFAKGAVVLVAGYFIAKITFEKIFKFAARNDELLFIFTLSILFIFSVIYSQIGFSVAIGAFIAGLLLGQLPYKYEMMGQTKGLKEFFAVIFFASIGLALTPIDFKSIVLPFFTLLILIIVGIPLVIITSLGILGYKKRTSFLSAISLIQVSEFSLILFRVGVEKGHITTNLFNVAILLSLVTLTITTYVIKYDERMYAWIGKRLGFLERLSIHDTREMSYEADEAPDVILVGYDRIGYSIYNKLKWMDKKTIIVDINPDIVKKLAADKIPCIYGDIGDVEIVERLQLGKAKVVISTIPNHNETIRLISEVRKRNPSATIIVTGYEADEAMELYGFGADYVILPHFLGGEHLSVIMDDLTGSLGKRLNIKINHLKALQERKNRHGLR